MYLKILIFYIQIKNLEIKKFLKHKLLHIFCNFLKLKLKNMKQIWKKEKMIWFHV